MKKIISSPLAPKAIGPYSQAVLAGNLLFVSGQIPIDPATGALIPEKDIQSQTRRVLLNLEAILRAAGIGLDAAVRMTVFLKSMDDFVAMNAVYAEFLTVDPPSRSTVEVSRLPKDAAVEIDCVAFVSKNSL